MKKNEKKIYKLIDICFIICIGAFYFLWASHLRESLCPDEYMRDDVPLWILNHGRLPAGDEPELRNPILGFSYGFVPYLTSLIGVLFSKISGIFTNSEAVCLIALRMGSVLSGVGTAIFALKIGKRIFNNRISDYIFASFICLLPQFSFLSSYLNNDAFSVFTTVALLYCWICGLQDGWNIKNSILFGTFIGLCALSYYNAYGFILCSIIMYIFSWIGKDKKFDTKKFFKFGLIIAGVALIVGGWFFIRNAVIHDGDFLGMKTQYNCGEMYGSDEFKPSNRNTLKNAGDPILSLFKDGKWIIHTLFSFVISFGYINVPLSVVLVAIFYMVLGIGAVIGLKKCIKNKDAKLFTICLLLSMIIPCLLSVYYSYAIDYQAQGRYIISALPGIAFFAALGYDRVLDKHSKRKQTGLLVSVISVWLILFVFVVINYIIPGYWVSGISEILG